MTTLSVQPGDNDKLARILDAAADCFASQPFHKVLLSDVARAAGVGKGTLYLYFSSKEELYFSVLFRGFSQLVQRLRAGMAESGDDPRQQLGCIVRALVQALYANSTITELLRGALVGNPNKAEWTAARLELRELIREVIERGVAMGEFQDANPELTAHYIPGLIRSVALFRPESATVDEICEHALHFILAGLRPAADSI